MTSKRWVDLLRWVCVAFFIVALWTMDVTSVFAQNAQSTTPGTNYDALISEGKQFLKDGKLKDAYQHALSAAEQDSKRFEAYALAAFVLHKQGSHAKAKDILDEALSRAPADKRDALLQFQKRMVAEVDQHEKAQSALKRLQTQSAESNPSEKDGARQSRQRVKVEPLSLNEYRQRLDVSDNDEWRVIRPLINSVLDAWKTASGLTVPDGPEAKEMQKVLETSLPAPELRAKLAGLRAHAGGTTSAKSADLVEAQANLRRILSTRQEAFAVLLGLLE